VFLVGSWKCSVLHGCVVRFWGTLSSCCVRPLINASQKCFYDDSEPQAMRRTVLFRFERSVMFCSVLKSVLLIFRSICYGSSSSVISCFQNMFVLITGISLFWCLAHICQHVDILSFHNMAVRSCLIIFLITPT